MQLQCGLGDIGGSSGSGAVGRVPRVPSQRAREAAAAITAGAAAVAPRVEPQAAGAGAQGATAPRLDLTGDAADGAGVNPQTAQDEEAIPETAPAPRPSRNR